MFDLIRENPKRAALILALPALMAIVYLLLVVRYTYDHNDGYVGALLDDTWIHVRFADSIAQGEGLSYNEGEITPGATSPLWVLQLAAVYVVTNPDIDTQVHIAIAMSAVWHVLTVLAVTGFGWWTSRRAWIGVLAGILTALTGRYIWMGLSGMETTAFAALCVVALWSHIDDVQQKRTFGWRTGVLTALATLARPDGYLLAAIIGLDAFIIVPLRDQKNWEALWLRVRYGWRGIVSYVMLAGTYPLATLLMTGHPLPNTFRVKSQLGKEFPDLPYAYFWTPRVDQGWLLIILAGIGIGFLLWRDWTRRDRTGVAWALWPTVFVLATLYLGAQHFVINNGRYVAPAIPFHALAAAVGVWAVTELVPRVIRARGIGIVMVLGVLLIGATFWFDFDQWRFLSQETFLFALILVAICGFVAVIAIWVRTRHAVPPPNTTESRSAERNRHWLIAALLGVLLIGTVFGLGSRQGAGVANDVYQLNAMHVAAGYFLRDNTEPDQTIALNDVGAIVHIADRRVLDMIGLVSPDVTEAISEEPRFTCPHDLQLARVMLDDPPAVIAIFPWFFPCLSTWEGALQPFNVFEIQGPTVIANGELILYWPVWENWPVQNAIAPDADRVEVSFEQGIALAGYDTNVVENGLEVTLWWQPTARPTGDYTVFVHLINAEDDILAQNDSRPQRGQFNTLWWRDGDIIPDRHFITLDNAEELDRAVALRVGLYPTGGSGRLRRVPAPIDEPDFVILPLE